MGFGKRNEVIRRVAALALLIALILQVATPSVFWAAPNSAPSVWAPRNDHLGLAHIGYGSKPPEQPRYQLAVEAGATWNRWAVYWHDIELTPGLFQFDSQDATVHADAAHGLSTLGILFGTPQWASTAPHAVGAASLKITQVGPSSGIDNSVQALQGPGQISTSVYPPKNLNLGVFSDGTDTPGLAKDINNENYWARFVYRTVLHFKGRIRHWEIWNEPDFSPSAESGWFGFWNGSLEEYHRMMKVAYLAAKAADPDAVIVMGSMAYWFDKGYFPRLLDSLQKDPDAAAHDYYFDVTGWHWYSRPIQLYDRTLWVKELLRSHGMQDKRVWITETNLPVCGDPSLDSKPRCGPGSHRGTLDHQASFVLQATAYALAAGVERIFFFQLFDDELNPFEYFGLVRNDGTRRPAYAAFQIAATYLRDSTTAYRTSSNRGRLELINLYTRDNRRVQVAWNASGSPQHINLPLERARASIIQQDTITGAIDASLEGTHRLSLPQATLNNNSSRYAPDYIVGGPTFVIQESGVAPQAGLLRGTIRDQLQKPLAGARVELGLPTDSTDENGEFKVPLLPGLYDVKATAPNHLASEPILSVAVWGGRHTDIDFTLNFGHTRLLPIIFTRP